MVDLDDVGSTDARSITEQDINWRVAEVMRYEIHTPENDDNVRFGEQWYYNGNKRVSLIWEYRPLTDSAQLCRLLMDNWEGITNKLDIWFSWRSTGNENPSYEWWEHPDYLANKELWILRALVAYKEGEREQV